MARLEMVPLTEVGTAFEARLLAARLGAAGILSQVRGAHEGPYPVGSVAVLVDGTQLAEARELLLADEVDDVLARAEEDTADLDPADADPPAPAWGLATPLAKTCLAVAAIVLLAAAVFGALSMLI